MPVHGKTKNEIVAVPNGIKPAGKSKAKPSSRRKLLRHAGKASGIPADAARNLEHYLYGHTKR
jgi:hypothetical protein